MKAFCAASWTGGKGMIFCGETEGASGFKSIAWSNPGRCGGNSSKLEGSNTSRKSCNQSGRSSNVFDGFARCLFNFHGDSSDEQLMIIDGREIYILGTVDRAS